MFEVQRNDKRRLWKNCSHEDDWHAAPILGVHEEMNTIMINVACRKRHSAQRKQDQTWSQIARLSGEAITALDAGKAKDACGRLVAIRAVALNADKKACKQLEGCRPVTLPDPWRPA